jgi:hypothetical protein
MKPDVNRVSGIKHGNYNKLNEKGYIPEETEIEENDVLIGKVTPIQPSSTNNMKIFKDSSTVYRSSVKGVVDKVYTGIYNADGYEMYTMRIRNERFPRVGDKFCLDQKSEVLTNKGWIKFDEMYHRYKLGEEFTVATLHDGKFIKYDKPIDVYEFDYDGYMYKLTSQQVDFCITMDHEMWARKRDKNYFELVKAADLYGKRYNLKKDGWIDKPDVETIDINGKVFKMDDFLDLLGIFIADGCISGSYINLAGTKQRKIDHITEVCKRMNLKYARRQYELKEPSNSYYGYAVSHDVSCNPLKKWLVPYNVGAINKYLPEFVFELNSRQARILLESLISCDGSHNNQGSECYYTSSKKLADDVMKLAIHAGWSGSVKTLRKEGHESELSDGRLIKSNADALSVRIIKTKNEPQVNHGHKNTQSGQTEELVKHKGKVYCLEVPSHVFMMRYNNKNVWSGNCSRAGSFKRSRA